MSKPTEWLQKKYQDLIKDSSFASFIGGNVPQFDKDLSGRHDIICCDDQVNLIFEDYRLRNIIFLSPHSSLSKRYIAMELDFFKQPLSISDVIKILGDPDEKGEARKLPGLVQKGWIRYNRETYKVTFSIDNLDSDIIADIRFRV
ncbi:hypothetical protein VA7868_03709 [Vibrio aerogenes CECT 7868]|uniref:Uncharacterized protein n=1 Tax=Vibrio aerogenes CECT 7868 TaxID=1216006 RepID=A0A1M6B4N0_9VIBR|nr:hypothetical protein [Vibrio aerogenes]SHI43709.1 hypothetical protein VA7868_03709 [Vibrio aerogenes CECT 7868]